MTWSISHHSYKSLIHALEKFHTCMHGIALVMVIDYVAIYTRLAKFQRNKLEPIALEVKLSIITT